MVPTQPILIGTAGYSSPGTPPKGWYGAFYPDAKPKGFDELEILFADLQHGRDQLAEETLVRR